MKPHWHPNMLRKMKMRDTRHEHNTRLSVCNYNESFYSKSNCHQTFLHQFVYEWNSIPLYIRNRDSLKLFKGLYKEYLLFYQ